MVKVKFNKNWSIGKNHYKKGDIAELPGMTARELVKNAGLIEVIEGKPAKKTNDLNNDDFKRSRFEKKKDKRNDIIDGVLYMFGRPSMEIEESRKPELMENVMDVLKGMGIERAGAFAVLFCNKKCKSWADIEKAVSDMFVVIKDKSNDSAKGNQE